jgi:hypothetical protein
VRPMILDILNRCIAFRSDWQFCAIALVLKVNILLPIDSRPDLPTLLSTAGHLPLIWVKSMQLILRCFHAGAAVITSSLTLASLAGIVAGINISFSSNTWSANVLRGCGLRSSISLPSSPMFLTASPSVTVRTPLVG